VGGLRLFQFRFAYRILLVANFNLRANSFAHYVIEKKIDIRKEKEEVYRDKRKQQTAKLH
jgi:hypothetical protein